MRGAITFAGRLRRAPKPPSHPAAAASAQEAGQHSPRRPRAARRPAAQQPPVTPARPGLFARWFGPRRSRPAHRALAGGNAPFTPDAYPGLPPEFCAILNTPVEDCDPVFVRLLLAAVAQQIVNCMPTDSGMADARQVFSALLGRLGVPLPDEAEPEAPPDLATAIPADAASDAPPPEAPLPEPQAPEAQPPAPADNAAAPAAAALPRRAPYPRLQSSQSIRRSRRSRVRCSRSADGPHRPPLRRLCYAACAGPP